MSILRRLFFARNRTDGLVGGASSAGMKLGYVIYPDGLRSIDMPAGNAMDYAEIFGGVVILKPAAGAPR